MTKGRGLVYRLWTLLGIVVLAGMVLMGLLMLLGRGPGVAAPVLERTPMLWDVNQSSGTIPADAVIAIVDGEPIHYGAWREAVLLDRVMSGLAGQSPPSNDETLERIINELLVLQSGLAEVSPTDEQVAQRIAQLEQPWKVEEALEAVELEMAALENAVRRLLAVESGLEAVRTRGERPEVWLEEQLAKADVQVAAGITSLPVRGDSTALASPTLPPPTATPTYPRAVDFTLRRAGGGSLTLTEQLGEGPVVIVFIQRCG